MEADDLGTYVVKFSGAGQGRKVLVAEVLVGEIARRLGIPTPRLAVVDMPSAIARYEADEEVQDLLNASPGHNLGVDFLPGSFGYDGSRPPSAEAGAILWLDAYTANVDRTWANPNLLVWHGQTWAIDHGAASGSTTRGPADRPTSTASSGSRSTPVSTCWPPPLPRCGRRTNGSPARHRAARRGGGGARARCVAGPDPPAFWSGCRRAAYVEHLTLRLTDRRLARVA